VTYRLSRAVSGRGVTLIRRLFDGAPQGCINLGLGQPTDPVPESVRRAAVASLETGLVPYTATLGMPALCDAVARRVYGDERPGSVMVTSGSQEALWVAVMGLVDPGDDVLLPEPAYPAYRLVVEMVGARVVSVPLRFEDRWKVDVRALEAAWTDRTRMVILASPANPTGMFAGSDADLARVHDLCSRRDAWLLADELYAPIAFEVAHRPAHVHGERVVALSGISKAFSATGFRVGWLHAHPDVVRGLMPLHQQVALVAPTTGQHAALACVDLWGGPFFDELRARYALRREAALDGLAGIPDVRYHAPEGAFYVLVDVSAHVRDTFAFALRLRDEQRVITAPGEAFGEAGAGHLRISFATDPGSIREGLRRLGAALVGRL
jgi:aspartate/methionine/tyrosine aminotransferase